MDGESRSQAELGEYVCAGYFLAEVAKRPSYCNSTLVPAEIVTVSPCLTKTMPRYWILDRAEMTETRKNGLVKGLVPTDGERLIAWATERISRREIALPNLFCSKSVADEFLETFPFDRNNWRLLGLGLHQNQLRDFLEDLGPEGPSQTRSSASSPFLLYQAIARSERLDRGGRLIGFDVLAMDGYGECHSWFCNSLEEPIAAELGIRPGAFGLLPTWRDADACAEYASRPEVGAEPLPWYAYAVINYPI